MTTTTTTTAPLAALINAEANLAATIHRAADHIDGIATVVIDAALERLQQSADAARGRLAVAFARINSIVGDVLDNLNDMAGAINEQIETPVAPVQPATVEEKQPAEQPIDLSAETVDDSTPASTPSKPATARTPSEKVAEAFARMAGQRGSVGVKSGNGSTGTSEAPSLPFPVEPTTTTASSSAEPSSTSKPRGGRGRKKSSTVPAVASNGTTS